MARVKVTVTLDPRILKDVDALVEKLVYRNRSHAVEVALMKLIKEAAR